MEPDVQGMETYPIMMIALAVDSTARRYNADRIAILKSGMF
jgi:hypothetical protein